VLAGVLAAVSITGQKLVREFLHALVAEIETAQHQQRGHEPRREGADRQGGRHEDALVDRGTLEHGPDDRQLVPGIDSGDLLRIEGEIVSEDTGGLLGGNLGQHRHVVEYAGDIIEQRQQACSSHDRLLGSGWQVQA
jgi:hypothetical protein